MQFSIENENFLVDTGLGREDSDSTNETFPPSETTSPAMSESTSQTSQQTNRYGRQFSICQEIFLYSKMQTCFVVHLFSC
jgi:hypothetical protein